MHPRCVRGQPDTARLTTPVRPVLSCQLNARRRGDQQHQRGTARNARNATIHAPIWETTVHGSIVPVVRVVSIHFPTWGAMPGSSTWFQSTPPHEGRRRLSLAGLLRLHISIHASAWRGDRVLALVEGHGAVSIHAPTRGATAKYWQDQPIGTICCIPIFRPRLPDYSKQE